MQSAGYTVRLHGSVFYPCKAISHLNDKPVGLDIRKWLILVLKNFGQASVDVLNVQQLG
jgi:hypothetical protein